MTQDEKGNSQAVTQGDKEKTSPPYISFLTFNNLISWLETEGVPIKFDRSIWGKKYGGSLGTQLMAGLRFLGLLKGDFTQPQFGEIVKAKGEERKNLLAEMIKSSYSAVDFSQLSAAAPSMLKEWFTQYNLDGSTDRKARSFFVNACKAYDIPLSNSLKKTARNKNAAKVTREKNVGKINSQKVERTNPDKKEASAKQNLVLLEEIGQQDLFKVVLSDGCELKLCSNRAFFDIEKPDRELIENLVEVMKNYRQK